MPKEHLLHETLHYANERLLNLSQYITYTLYGILRKYITCASSHPILTMNMIPTTTLAPNIRYFCKYRRVYRLHVCVYTQPRLLTTSQSKEAWPQLQMALLEKSFLRSRSPPAHHTTVQLTGTLPSRNGLLVRAGGECASPAPTGTVSLGSGALL